MRFPRVVIATVFALPFPLAKAYSLSEYLLVNSEMQERE